MTVLNQQPAITSWQQFRQLTQSRGCRLLRRLGDFPRSILVAGCQRSGKTILSRIMTQSDGTVNCWFGTDGELAAELILTRYMEPEFRVQFYANLSKFDLRSSCCLGQIQLGKLAF
jgi:hypothetical protein